MLKTNRTTYRTLHVRPLAALCLLMLTACSSDTVQPDNGTDQQGKTPIELAVGIVGDNTSASVSRGVTRTVVTTDNPYGKPATAFGKGTSLYMVMKSESKAASGGTKYTRTIGFAQTPVSAVAPATESTSTEVGFASQYVRYWEDAHSRNSQLSIYSVCVPGYHTAGSIYDGITANGTAHEFLSVGSATEADYSKIAPWEDPWPATSPTTIVWPLHSASVSDQTTEGFLERQDLCFSNNVSNLTGNSPEDNRIKFNSVTNKFDAKRMIFYHALTKVTFKIKKGTGFDTAPFKFPDANNDDIDDSNIVLNGFNTTGTFDIVNGEFTPVNSSTSIDKFAVVETNTTATADEPSYAYVLTALLLPGTELNGTDKDALDKISFTIDNNKYHVTKAQLNTALSGKTLSNNTSALDGETGKMRAGVHYIFKMEVGKKEVDKLTAALVPWEDVTADNTQPTNARVKVSLLDDETHITGESKFDLYRSTITHGAIADNDHQNYEWAKGYTETGNKITPTWDGTNSHYTTTWLWPDNKTFYHFRAVMPVDHTVSTDNKGTIENADDDEDYITLSGEVINETSTGSDDRYTRDYTGVCWGAPFKASTDKLTYSTTTGFNVNTTIGTGENAVTSPQIYKAIGATEDVIKMMLFHMMSDVTIKLTTPTESSDPDYVARVDLAGAKLDFTNISSTGKVRMGDGLVTADAASSFAQQTVDASYKWRWAFVPQDLTNVVLTITTADNNQYKVDMKEVLASAVTSKLIKNPYTAIAAEQPNAGMFPIVRWYPNFKYVYTFKLTKKGIDKITATLADWETVTAGKDDVQIE